LTKENYAKYLLSAKSFGIIFAADERIAGAVGRGAADCGAVQHWLGTRMRAGGTESKNGGNQGAR
jgi:hypothetical protein